MKRVQPFVFVLVAALALVASVPVAAQFANADLDGTVRSADGAALPGVTVTATNQASGLSRSTVSAASGSYAINGLRPGLYTVTFQLEGFQTVKQEGVELRVGQEARLNVRLELGTVEESIVVTGAAPMVDVTSKEIGGTLTEDEIKALPTQNRSALLFASLMPGVVPEPSTESTSADALFVNGQDDNNNSFNMDGANNDDDVIGARAGAQVRTPMEAIQEFQVLTTQFDAEFGRALGGVLNAVTKSGGNDFSGSAFAFLQDSSFDEPNFFVERAGLEKPDTTYKSLGFTLGGPIVRDKAHFFVSRENNKDQAGVVANFPSRPEFNFTTTTDNKITNTLAKVDYQPSTHHHLAYRYLLENSPQFNQIIPVGGTPVTLNSAREEDDTDSNWTFTVESVLNDRAFNTGRISFTKEDVAFANPGFNNNGQNFASQRNQAPQEIHPGFVDGASTVAQARVDRSTQIDDTFSYFVPDWNGDHEFRLGFQWAKRQESFTNFGTLNGDFRDFTSDRPFDANDVTTYPGFFFLRVLGGQTAPIPDNKTMGVFVQDDWQVRSNLTINLGLRYDKEDITNDNNIAPRIGFTWDPQKDGRTVVRGGFGRFYDRFQMGFYQNFFLDSVSLPGGFILRYPDAGSNRQLLFDLAQQNGVTTLSQLRDVLANILEGGAGAILNTQPTVDNPNRRQPYADSFSLGAEREIWSGISASVDLIRTENRDILITADLNPSSTAAGGRPNISILNGQPVAMGGITTWVNAGSTNYDAVQLALRKRTGKRLSGRISYTYASSSGNNEGGGGGTADAYFQARTETGYNFDNGTIIGQPLDLGLSDPRTNGIPVNWNRRHNFVISGTYLVPHTSWRENRGLEVAWIYRYLTGNQTTLLDNRVRLDNGNRAPLPAGNYSSSSDIGQSVGFDGKLQGAENPSFKRLDLSLRYNIPFGQRYNVQLLADVFNLFDTTNFGSVGGTIGESDPARPQPASFLTPNSALNPRQFQLGVRFEF